MVDRFLDGATPYDNFQNPKISITELERIADYDKQINAPRLTLDLSQIAMMYQDMGRPKKAEGLYQEVLEIRRAKLPPNDPDIAAALHNLGALYELEEKPDTAAKYYQEALNIWESSDRSNPSVVAHEVADLGDLYWYIGKPSVAEPLFRRALTWADKVQPPDYELTAEILGMLETTLDEQHKGAEVEQIEKQREIVKQKIPPRKRGPLGPFYVR